MVEASSGRALALLALAPIAAREADERERREGEEQEKAEAAERARKWAGDLEAALAEVPELSLPQRPAEPPHAQFDGERFVITLWFTLWSIPAFFIFGLSVGAVVPMLVLSILLALTNGFWPVLQTASARERYGVEMQEYEAATREAEHRDAERAEVRERFEREREADAARPGEFAKHPAEVGQQQDLAGSQVPVRVDGCYVTDWRDGSLFARFFEDGTVMIVPTEAGAEALALSQLVLSSDASHRGDFIQDGSEITFLTSSPKFQQLLGAFECQGKVQADGTELRLHVLQLINDHQFEEERVWRFISDPD